MILLCKLIEIFGWDLLISDKDQILPNLIKPNAFGSAGYWCQRSVRSSLTSYCKDMLKSILFFCNSNARCNG
jgi:hypothetical protein